jgi:hypothetical protein
MIHGCDGVGLATRCDARALLRLETIVSPQNTGRDAGAAIHDLNLQVPACLRAQPLKVV